MAVEIDKEIGNLASRRGEIENQLARMSNLRMFLEFLGIGDRSFQLDMESVKILTEIKDKIKSRPGEYELGYLEGMPNRDGKIVFDFGFRFQVQNQEFTINYRQESFRAQEGEVERPLLQIDNEGNHTVILPKDAKIRVTCPRLIRIFEIFTDGYLDWQPKITNQPHNISFPLRDDMEWVAKMSLGEIRSYTDTLVED